jgi:alpha-N-arabinofuranosidase
VIQGLAPVIDYYSIHLYTGQPDHYANVFSAHQAERAVRLCGALLERVRHTQRIAHPIHVAFDEWNVWYRARSGDATNGHGKEAPHLLEEVYNLEDALLVGGILNSLIRNADRVKLACLAQLINVIAPIMTNANGMFRQTIYYPYSWALQYARGSVLNLLVKSPAYEVAGMGQVPYLDVAGTVSTEDGKVSLFIFNRDLAKSRTIEVSWQDKAPGRVLSTSLLTGDDLKAFNSFETPQKVAPRTLDKPSIAGGRAKFEVPARSYAVIQWGA